MLQKEQVIVLMSIGYRSGVTFSSAWSSAALQELIDKGLAKADVIMGATNIYSLTQAGENLYRVFISLIDL